MHRAPFYNFFIETKDKNMNIELHNEESPNHVMTLPEREVLKEFARKGMNLEQIIIMIAHWMSCNIDVTFSGYAANWAVANTMEDVTAIRKQWPLSGPRMIADNMTSWGSYKQHK
jgi:hypothetical protein